MDTRTGRIFTDKEVEQIKAEHNGLIPDYIKPMEVAPTVRQLGRRPPRVGRNEPCPCGSGKKFKRCCWTRRAEAQP